MHTSLLFMHTVSVLTYSKYTRNFYTLSRLFYERLCKATCELLGIDNVVTVGIITSHNYSPVVSNP